MFKQFLHLLKDSSSESRAVPVVLCFVKCDGELLLLERGYEVEFYKCWWNVVTGYWDGKSSIPDRVREKLLEELGVTSDYIATIKLGKPYRTYHFVIEQEWLMHPVFVELKKKPPIHLSEQHQGYRWVKPSEVKEFSIVPRVSDALDQFKSLS